MTRRPLRLVAPVLVVGATAVITACSSSNAYDSGKIESYLKDSQEGKVRGLPLGEASCPEDVELTEGVTFRCTLEIAGVKAPYTVKLTNVDADEVRINLEPAKALIATAVVADLVHKGLKEQYRDQATIDCGKDQLLVVDPGTKIGCIVEIDGKQQQAIARVKDKDGTVVLER